MPGIPIFARMKLQAGLDWLLPPHCLTCDAPVPVQGQLCAACFRGLGFVTAPFCARCAVPFANPGQAGPGGLCPTCQDRAPSWRQARAALRYDDASRRLILPFKHTDRTELAMPLARHMQRAGAALLQGAGVIVPVPLHRRRLLARRYNQAALLARCLARLSGVAVLPDALERRLPTARLGGQGAAARHEALQGVFAVRPARAAQLQGRVVLLVDDVMTSGATAEHCARALLKEGAAAVDVLVAARVPDPRLG